MTQDKDRLIQSVATVSGLTLDEATAFIQGAIAVGRLKTAIKDGLVEKQSLLETSIRCTGTPVRTRYIKADDTFGEHLRLIHSTGEDMCPYCGERPEGKMRLRRYVRQVDHAEAEQALQNQARLQTLEHLLGEAQEWLADMERCIGEWERANALALALSLETTVNVETETPIDIEDNEGDNG